MSHTTATTPANEAPNAAESASEMPGACQDCPGTSCHACEHWAARVNAEVRYQRLHGLHQQLNGDEYLWVH